MPRLDAEVEPPSVLHYHDTALIFGAHRVSAIGSKPNNQQRSLYPSTPLHSIVNIEAGSSLRDSIILYINKIYNTLYLLVVVLIRDSVKPHVIKTNEM